MIALVPTCNRPELFARLVSKLEYFEVIGFVNNSTPENVEKYKALTLPENVRLVFTDIKGEPKRCHVKTFRMMINYATKGCLIIEDDVVPCNKFFIELCSNIYALKQISTEFTLSPIYLPNRNSDRYTGGQSRQFKHEGFEFMDQAWVDGNFYMTSGVLAAMKEWIKPRVKIFGASSGIGRLNSKKMVEHNWKMFTTVPTLVEHLDHESVMFGNRRTEIPLIAKFNQ